MLSRSLLIRSRCFEWRSLWEGSFLTIKKKENRENKKQKTEKRLKAKRTQKNS